jgi:hypothetical protein
MVSELLQTPRKSSPPCFRHTMTQRKTSRRHLRAAVGPQLHTTTTNTRCRGATAPTQSCGTGNLRLEPSAKSEGFVFQPHQMRRITSAPSRSKLIRSGTKSIVTGVSGRMTRTRPRISTFSSAAADSPIRPPCGRASQLSSAGSGTGGPRNAGSATQAARSIRAREANRRVIGRLSAL